MNNIYQKNIIFQKLNTKHNPDVLKKKESEDKSRLTSIFKKSSITYNSITNEIPSNIKTQKDLELNIDKPLNNIDQIILNKKKERDLQDLSNKPLKQKVIAADTSVENITNNFNELKEDQTTFINTQKIVIESNKNKFNDIMKNLKELGILNN